MSLTTNMNSFIVKALAEFKGAELEDSQMLCRKIEKGTGKESRGVVIEKPTQESFIAALNNDTVLQGAYAWYLQQVEAAVKARIDTGAAMIVPADFTTEVVAEMMQQQEIAEGRISKEKIACWFNAEVSPVLYAAFAEKLGDALSNDKATEILKMYAGAFSTFAKREYSFSEQAHSNLSKVLELLPASNMKLYCEKKLVEMAPKYAADWVL